MIQFKNNILLKSETSYEFTISQFQKQTDEILCVRDGCEFLIFNSTNDIPNNLQKEYVKKNNDLETMEYHFRSQNTDSLYVFFREDILNYLEVMEDKEIIGRPVMIDDISKNSKTKKYMIAMQ